MADVPTILPPPSQHGFQEEQQPRAQAAVDDDDDGHSDSGDLDVDMATLDDIFSDDDQMLVDDEPPSLSAVIPLEAALQQVAASRLRFRERMRTATTMPHGEGEGYSNGGFGSVPASATAVAGLGKQEFRAGSGRDGAAEGSGAAADAGCMICFEEFADGEEVSVMPCSGGQHEFHTQCIGKWLGVSNMCPLCRYKLPAAQTA